MTTDPRREIVELLGEMCELSPDVRVGQLLAHLGFLGEDETGRTLWDLDDEQLLAVLYRHRAELLARQSISPPPIVIASDSGQSAPDSPAAGKR